MNTRQRIGMEQETTGVQSEASGQTVGTKESSTPAEEVPIEDWEKQPRTLGAFASLISNPGKSLASSYTNAGSPLCAQKIKLQGEPPHSL